MLFSFQCLCEICSCLIFTLFTQNDNARSSVNCCAVCIEKHALCSTAGAAQCFSPLTLTHSCADVPGSRQHLVYLPEKSPGSGLWQLTFFFLCNLDLSIYTSAAVLFIDPTVSSFRWKQVFTDHKSKFGHNSGTAKIWNFPSNTLSNGLLLLVMWWQGSTVQVGR